MSICAMVITLGPIGSYLLRLQRQEKQVHGVHWFNWLWCFLVLCNIICNIICNMQYLARLFFLDYVSTICVSCSRSLFFGMCVYAA